MGATMAQQSDPFADIHVGGLRIAALNLCSYALLEVPQMSCTLVRWVGNRYFERCCDVANPLS